MMKGNRFTNYVAEYIVQIVFAISAVALCIYAYYISANTSVSQMIETNIRKRSSGVVIEKTADPAGYSWGFWEHRIVYRPDRYYLKVRLDDESVMEVNVDAVTYMNIKIGDRVKYNVR